MQNLTTTNTPAANFTSRALLAKAIAAFKKELEQLWYDLKGMNYKTVVNNLRSFGVTVGVENWSEYKDTMSENGKYAITRRQLNGSLITFTIGGKKFEGFTKADNFSFNLTSFLAQNINAIELAKELMPVVIPA